jgi:hypothetical protein
VYPPAASPAFIFGEKFHQNEKNKKGYSFIFYFIFSEFFFHFWGGNIFHHIWSLILVW